jgi:serine beta-lactamase-like protein LACTB, mitochondrial
VPGVLLVTAAAAVLASRIVTASAVHEKASCGEWLVAPAYRDAARPSRVLLPRLWRGLRAPGLTAAVAVRGRVVWSAGCGLADRERGVPVRRSTRFRIGSLSKPLTSAGLARLHERGRLDLEANIQRYVPSFPRKQWPVTIRQLASHLGGLRGNEAGELVNTRRFGSVDDEVALFADDPLVYEPGTRFSYSNAGWVLLGAAIEGASGRSYAETMRAEVTEPLSLHASVLDDAGLSIPNRSRLYEIADDGRAVVAPRHDVSIRWPSGGFVSTAEDMARFGSAFVGGSFLRAATVHDFLTPQRTSDGRPTGYGLGWEIHESPLGTWAGHTGNTVGGTATLLVHVPTGVAFAVTTNLGYVTASDPPRPRSTTPDPPLLAAPFVAGVQTRSR